MDEIVRFAFDSPVCFTVMYVANLVFIAVIVIVGLSFIGSYFDQLIAAMRCYLELKHQDGRQS